MKKTFTKQNKILVVLGLIGFLIFAALYGRLSPVSAIRMNVDEKTASGIARTFFEQKDINFEEYEKDVRLKSDGEQIMYLQKSLGFSKANTLIRERIPAYYWEVVWRRKGEFELVVGQEKENIEISDEGIVLKAKIDGNGNLFSFDYSIVRLDTEGIKVLKKDEALTLEIKLLNEDEAFTLAHTFLSQNMDIDLSGYERKEKAHVEHQGETDWDFQWIKRDVGIADERIEVGVAIKGNQVVTYDYAYRVPEGMETVYERETDKPAAYIVFIVLSWVAVGILFLVLFFIKAVRSELEYRFGLRLGIILAALNLVSAIAALYDGQWSVFLGAAIGSIVVCFGASLIWAVCDSLARSTWKEKLAIVDALIRRRFLTVEFGRATLKGYALACICLGVLTLLSTLGVGASLLWLTDEGALDQYMSTFSFIHLITDAIIVALFIEIFFRLFLVSYLRSKIRSLPLVVLLSGLILGVNGIQFFNLAPTWASVLSMCLVACIFSYAFVRYELTTVVTGTFVIIVLWRAWPFLYMGDTIHFANGFASMALVAVPFILGYISIRSGESVEQMEEYIPPYMARALEQERMKQELEIARQVQRSFLPRTYPRVEGLDIAAVCVPANEVGGDYYDFIPSGPRCVSIALGDVSGKGVSAAFYMALTKGILRAEAADHNSPKEILTEVNARFYENSDPNVFISMVYGTLDPEKGHFTYARAGHNPVILRRRAGGTPESFTPSGIALGLDRGEIFDQVLVEETMDISPGDVLVLYTDGFTEAINWRKEEFGEERLLELIEQNRGKRAVEIVASIEEEIQSFVGETSQRDDMTMVVVKIL